MENNCLINYPEGDFRRKFIQVYVKGKPYMKISPDSEMHGISLKELLIDFEIPFQIFKDEGKEIPFKKDSNGLYQLVGAGRIYSVNEKPELSKYSKSYMVGPNRKHADEITKLTGIEFSISRI